jgi:hypothetical protein
MQEENLNNDKFSVEKPSYDARLAYYAHLKIIMDTIFIARMNNKYNSWFEVLDHWFAFGSPYFKENDLEEIENKIKKIEGLLEKLDNINSRTNGYGLIVKQLKDNLRATQRKLFMSSKFMLLPIKEDDEGYEIDFNEFDKLVR